MWQRSVRGVLPGFACSRVPGQQCRPLSVAMCGSNGLATVQRTQQRNLCAEHYRRVLLQERAAERYVRCADPQSRGEAACSHRCMMHVVNVLSSLHDERARHGIDFWGAASERHGI